jgi:hypothetical protein
VSRQALYDTLEEKQPVTPIMALRLGKLCENGPTCGQSAEALRSAAAHQQLGEKINAIPTLAVA